MSKRLQVVMTDDEYSEIEEAAASARLTVSGWVRGTLRAARDPASGGQGAALGAVRERTLPYGEILTRVMERYGLPDAESAVRFALRRAADPPLSRDEILAMEGTGWEGDLDALRSSERPEMLR
jgi:Arc/MetJ family transcription regulator